MRTSRARRSLVAGVVALMAGAGLIALPSAATAQSAVVSPITDYDAYPANVPVPDTCPDGSPLTGLRFLQFRGGVQIAESSNMRDFDLDAFDSVVMAWDGYRDGCEGVGVSLSIKKTNQPSFLIEDNQELLPGWRWCGPGEDCVANGIYQLAVQLPSSLVSCNFQVDAAIGPPLQKVGPNGSYYSAGLRADTGKGPQPSRDMLISANNGGEGVCGIKVIPRKVWIPTIPAIPDGWFLRVEANEPGNVVVGVATCSYETGSFACTYANGNGLTDGLYATNLTRFFITEDPPIGGYQLLNPNPTLFADEFINCDDSGTCDLRIDNGPGGTTTTTGATTTVPTTPPPTTTPTTAPPPTPPPTVTVPPTTGPGTDVEGVTGANPPPVATQTPPPGVAGAGATPVTIRTSGSQVIAVSALPTTGPADSVPVMLAAYVLIAVGIVLLNDARRRAGYPGPLAWIRRR